MGTKYSDCILKPMYGQVALNDVELLKMLPRGLYLNVMLDMYDRDLRVHPFFRGLLKQKSMLMKKICSEVISKTLLAEKELLFVPGETAHAMQVLLRGSMSYTLVQRQGEEQH